MLIGVVLFFNKDMKAERSALGYFYYIGVDGIVLFLVENESEEYKDYLPSILP